MAILILRFFHSAQIDIFLEQLDFTLSETGPNSIVVLKTGTSTQPVTVSVTFFTYDEFEAAQLSPPTTPVTTDLPDAAECKRVLVILSTLTIHNILS